MMQNKEGNNDIYGQFKINQSVIERDLWSKLIKDEMKIMSLFLKSSNLILNLTIQIF